MRQWPLARIPRIADQASGLTNDGNFQDLGHTALMRLDAYQTINSTIGLSSFYTYISPAFYLSVKMSLRQADLACKSATSGPATGPSFTCDGHSDSRVMGGYDAYSADEASRQLKPSDFPNVSYANIGIDMSS